MAPLTTAPVHCDHCQKLFLSCHSAFNCTRRTNGRHYQKLPTQSCKKLIRAYMYMWTGAPFQRSLRVANCTKVGPAVVYRMAICRQNFITKGRLHGKAHSECSKILIQKSDFWLRGHWSRTGMRLRNIKKAWKVGDYCWLATIWWRGKHRRNNDLKEQAADCHQMSRHL